MSERDELIRKARIKRAKEKHAAESAAAPSEERDFFSWSPDTQLEAFKNQGKAALHGVNNILTGGNFDEAVARKRQVIDGSDYQTERDQIRASIANDVDKSPGGFLAGNLIAAPVVGMIPGANTTAGSAIMGGISGYGNTNSDDATEQVINTTIGTVLGGAGGAMATRAQNAGKTAEELAAKTFHPPKGAYDYHGPQGMRDLGRQALDDGLMNPFNNAEDNLNLANQNLSRTGALKAEAVRNGDPVDMHRVLQQAKGQLRGNGQWNSAELSGVQGALDEVGNVNNELARRGFEAKAVPALGGQKITNMVPAHVVDDAKMSMDNLPKWDSAGNMYPSKPYVKQFSTSLKNAVEDAAPGVGVLNPQYQRQLGLQELANHYFSTQGSRAGVLKGTGESLRNSGLKVSAMGLDKVQKIMQMDPKLLGKYEGPISTAIRRSPNALAAYIHVLNQDPEFREHVRQLEEQGY